MTSRQHQNWINRGKPDSGLVKPLAQLRDLLRAAGYTVYDFPNAEHLDHIPPEDHTYYSETNWPAGQELWWRHAIDIMPPPAGSNLPSLQTIGQHLYDARQAGGVPWLKYMNWPSTGDLSRAVQDRWEPSHARGSSGDTGHIHLSSTTGVQTLSSPFNPISLEVQTMTKTVDDVYNALTAIANGQQPPAGGSSAVTDWVKTMQSYGPKLDAIQSQSNSNGGGLTALGQKVDKLVSLVTAMQADLATLKTGAAGSAPSGDVSVSGTLHLGATS